MRSRPSPVLLAVFGLVVLIAAYLLLWKPRADDITTVRSEHDSLVQDLTAVRAIADSPPTTADPAAAGALAAAVPATPELPDLLRQFQTIGAETGVDVQTITPSPATAIPSVAGGSVAVTVTGSGTKAAIDTYVARLGAMARVFVIEKLNIAASTDAGAGPEAGAAPVAGALQLDLTGRVFTTMVPGTPGSNG